MSTLSPSATLVATTSIVQRTDGREFDQLRPISLTRGWSGTGEGSVLVEFGNTRVLCVASLTEGVPRWRKGSGEGWVTTEYAMLPRATSEHSQRESIKSKVSERTQEISRLIDRSLRAIIDASAFGENTIVLDCDVLRADGDTHTASVTGAYVALAEVVRWGSRKGIVTTKPGLKALTDSVSVIPVGIIEGAVMLDLPYEGDVRAQTGMNIIQTGSGDFIEVQGTAEHAPFSRDELAEPLDYASIGNAQLTDLQKRYLQAPAGERVNL